jgi:hypothetical protein
VRPFAAQLVACALAAAPLSGCFVLDEIDAGMAIMESHTPQDQKKKNVDPATGLQRGGGGGHLGARQRLADYYAEQRAKAPPRSTSTDPKDQMVRCNVGGTTHFMRRLDCQVRGGRVAALKGSGR